MISINQTSPLETWQMDRRRPIYRFWLTREITERRTDFCRQFIPEWNDTKNHDDSWEQCVRLGFPINLFEYNCLRDFYTISTYRLVCDWTYYFIIISFGSIISCSNVWCDVLSYLFFFFVLSPSLFTFDVSFYLNSNKNGMFWDDIKTKWNKKNEIKQLVGRWWCSLIALRHLCISKHCAWNVTNQTKPIKPQITA